VSECAPPPRRVPSRGRTRRLRAPAGPRALVPRAPALRARAPLPACQIMWPRSEEERFRQRLNGFVAFVKRGDASRAKEELNEIELEGYVMRIGWGKARSRPAAAAPPARMPPPAAEAAAASSRLAALLPRR
jgi:hypothetical protein